MHRRHFIAGLSCIPCLARADLPSIQGRNVEISPTTLSLAGPGATTICTVFNNGTETTASQIRLRAWSQVDGQDVLADTQDVVASPPFMSLPPGARQVVRIVNLAAQPSSSELAYRLLLNELPAAGSLTNNGITVLIAFNLPVFIAGVDAAPPQLSASFAQGADGNPVLRFTNGGDIHVRLADVTYSVEERPFFTLPGLVGYVLAHSTRDVPLPIPAPPPFGGLLVGQTQLEASSTPIQLL